MSDKEELFFENETRKHQMEVSKLLVDFSRKLLARAMTHDESKLKDPEKETFSEATGKLKELTYGSDEYKAQLDRMGPALEHHYQNNSHHPEHYKDGIGGMNLFDIVEMLCDWFAATLRHEDGDIYQSLDINEDRFVISQQLSQILKNTIKSLSDF